MNLTVTLINMEIQAKELRIGNLFNYHNQTVTVLSILQGGKSDFGYFKDSIGFERSYSDEDCPKPIPLTEEWFKRFGYTKKKGYKEKYFEFTDEYSEWLDLEDGTFKPKPYYFADAFEENFRIKYVHQLQNISFALTGKELTISE